MAKFLLHQSRDGSPLGVFNEDGDHYYFQNDTAMEEYGVAVNAQRSPNTNWDDWVEQMASKSPSPNGGMWDEYNHVDTDLESVLLDARNDTSYD